MLSMHIWSELKDLSQFVVTIFLPIKRFSLQIAQPYASNQTPGTPRMDRQLNQTPSTPGAYGYPTSPSLPASTPSTSDATGYGMTGTGTRAQRCIQEVCHLILFFIFHVLTSSYPSVYNKLHNIATLVASPKMISSGSLAADIPAKKSGLLSHLFFPSHFLFLCLVLLLISLMKTVIFTPAPMMSISLHHNRFFFQHFSQYPLRISPTSAITTLYYFFSQAAAQKYSSKKASTFNWDCLCFSESMHTQEDELFPVCMLCEVVV